jgi:hypothetical protein
LGRHVADTPQQAFDPGQIVLLSYEKPSKPKQVMALAGWKRTFRKHKMTEIRTTIIKREWKTRMKKK